MSIGSGGLTKQAIEDNIMKILLTYKFNIDTYYIEMHFVDGTMISVDIIAEEMKLPKICMNNLSWII